MRNLRKLLAALIVVTMIVSSLGAFAEEGSAAWTEETTADGWIKVTQENGPTLGYSPDSGVTILEVDGLAFKDLDRDGELDVYEDWRLDDNERAADLAVRLDYQTISAMIAHGDINSMNDDATNATIALAPPRSEVDADPAEADMVNYVLPTGQRTFISRLSTMPALQQARLNNNLQAVVEGMDYGIPINFTTDPRSQYADGASNLAMAATFDPELIGDLHKDLAKIYRAVGITTILGPQIDLTSEPRWSRFNGTYGEDPALSRDMTRAAITGFQSTYDEEGNDLGWGVDSVVAMMKHWPSDGPGEGGREAHNDYGKFNVYPGESFATGTIPFVDGGLDLGSATGMAGAAMTSYSIAYTDDESLGELVGSGYSEYKVQLLRSYGFDGVICTDGGIVDDPNTGHGVDDLDGVQRVYKILSAGVDQILGFKDIRSFIEQAYQLFVDDIGEEAALARYQESARRILKSYFEVGLFENPYVDSSYAVDAVDGDLLKTYVDEVADKSIVMLKNSEGTIHAAEGEEKPTVYIPMTFQSASEGYALPVSQQLADIYFNLVTDTPAEPSGEADEDGNATYTEADIVRADAAALAECDYALVFVSEPSTGSGFDSATGTYKPISLQYNEYTATGANVRAESIAGDLIETEIETPYGMVQGSEKENRSYYGESTVATNLSDLNLILDTAAMVPENVKTIVAVDVTNPMIFSEFESEVDAILVNMGVKDDPIMKIVAGQLEPSGLLPFQMPANMETVEAQYEDVPRDMECYVDADGNTYDFAFGMNWSGVIDDERVATYNVAPLTEPALQPVSE